MAPREKTCARQPRIKVRCPLPATTRTTDPPRTRLARLQFGYSARGRALPNPGRGSDEPGSTVPQRQRFRPYGQPTLVQMRQQHLEPDATTTSGTSPPERPRSASVSPCQNNEPCSWKPRLVSRQARRAARPGGRSAHWSSTMREQAVQESRLELTCLPHIDFGQDVTALFDRFCASGRVTRRGSRRRSGRRGGSARSRPWRAPRLWAVRAVGRPRSPRRRRSSRRPTRAGPLRVRW